MKKKISIILSIAGILSLFSPTTIYAVNIRNIPPFNIFANKSLGDYVGSLLNAAIIGAGIIAFLLFIGGGITMIAGAGKPQQQEKSKSAITAGVIGLVLVVSAYWIIQILEIITGINILNTSL